MDTALRAAPSKGYAFSTNYYTCIAMYGGPTRHFIKHLLHDFTKHLLHDFTISSTILQFPPRFYNFSNDFTISSTILQFPPRYYNFLHDLPCKCMVMACKCMVISCKCIVMACKCMVMACKCISDGL